MSRHNATVIGALRSQGRRFLLAAALLAALAGGGCELLEPTPARPTQPPAPTATVPPPSATAAPTLAPTQAATVPPPAPTQTASRDADFTIYFIDVEQGDATLIRASSGETLLVDAGRSGARIRDRLQRLGVADLDALMATHADADHIGGLEETLEMFPVERVYHNGEERGTQTFANFMAAARNEGAAITVLRRGDAIPLGDLTLQVLHPPELTDDSNADSIVLLLDCGEVEVLLTGDAEKPSEESMLAAGLLSDIDVLKVGHHGSSTSTSPEFINALRPEAAVISAGRQNSYGHPHREVMALLEGADVEIHRTDTGGADDTLMLTSDCHTYHFETAHPVP